MKSEFQWASFDPSRREAFERAITVSGAGSVLLQTFINKTVQQISNREEGVYSTLPRRPGQGNGAYINRRSEPGTLAQWVNDTDTINEFTGSYAQKSFLYRTLATKGRVTRYMQAQGRSYGDILAGEMAAKASDFAAAMEDCLVLGNNAAVAKQFDGLVTLAQETSSQIILQTTASAGDAFTLEKLDEAIDAVRGSGSRSDLLIFASRKGRRLINAALQSQQMFNDMTEIAAGFRVRTYDGIPLVTSTGMSDALTFNGSKVSAFSGAATTAICVVNTRDIYIEELTPLTVMPLAKSSSQYDEFDMYWDGSLVAANPLALSVLVGIDAA
jgi:hypothetical protein